MTGHSFTWGIQAGDPDKVNKATVNTPEEVDHVLREIHTPTVLSVIPPGPADALIEHRMIFCVGHPERAVVEWHSSSQTFFGLEPGLPEISEEIDFMYGYDECTFSPTRTRIRVETAARALKEYVATGQQPTCIEWHEFE